MNVHAICYVYTCTFKCLFFKIQVRVAGRSETVCQKAFASLYGVSVSRVRRIAQATSTSICAPVDKRGKHPRRSRIQLGGEVKEQIRQHIKSFPALKSHYSSGKSKARKYLAPLLSVAEMHRLYVEKHESNSETPLVKYSYYAKYFNSEFNLTFGRPKVDTCPTCEIFKNALQVDQACKWKIQQDHRLHLVKCFTLVFIKKLIWSVTRGSFSLSNAVVSAKSLFQFSGSRSSAAVGIADRLPRSL